MKIVKLSRKSLDGIIDFINNGGVAVFPTDTVYGFLADAQNKKAVDKIYKIKKRPKSKPLAVFVKDFKMAKDLAEIDDKQIQKLKAKWPGKYTFVLYRKKIKLYDGEKNTIAIRIPNYKFLNALLKKIDKPLVQTSVNISDNPALSKISDIIDQFNKFDILAVDRGNLKKSKASKIIDLTNNKIKILRP